jgi:4-hydroxybutyrate dehydrogenase/sulfolactaldehyde 3-reductase
MSETIGFIGLGAMGQPMASNMARAGFDMVVFDVDQGRCATLVELGAKVVGSVAEVAGAADIIVTMLPDGPDVEAVVLGAGGILANGRADQLVMDMSTIDPAVTDRIAAALGEQGLAFVDAPVGRLVSHAQRGESLFMVGASDNDFGRVTPLLEAMGTTIHHCGQPGSGIRTKLINNFVAIACCQVDAEAIALAHRFGLDIQRTLDVINGTTATNGHLKEAAWPSKVLAGDTEPGFRIRLAHKDISLAVEAARQAGVPVFAGAAIREALGQAGRTGDFGERDFSALLDVVCTQAGIKPPRL